MSTDAAINTSDCSDGQGCDTVELVIQPRDQDLGGFSVRRALPNKQQRKVGPWVFFDHMGPVTFPAGQGISVRPHPHINLATVTYLFEGEMLHRDSLGNTLSIQPGDINLMVAGKGIVHSERERPEVTAVEHRMHGLQLWLGLPEKDEERDPAFYHYPAQDLPSGEIDGVPLRVMMGQAYGLRSPVLTYADTLYVEAKLKSGQSLPVPDAEERAVYVAAGEIQIGDSRIPQYGMAVLKPDTQATIQAHGEARIAIIGGERLSERHIEWNFVSSSKARIEQAKADWKSGRFPTIPGDDKEFIPLPE